MKNKLLSAVNISFHNSYRPGAVLRLVFMLLVCLGACVSYGQDDLDYFNRVIAGKASDSAYTMAYYHLGKHYQYINTDSVNYYLAKGRELSRKDNYKQGLAWMDILNSALDADKGRLDIATARLNDAVDIFTEAKDEFGLANAYTGLGMVYGLKGNFNVAQKYILSSLQKGEALKDNKLIALGYLKLGVINEKNNNLEKALEDYQKALSLSQDSSGKYQTSYILNNIGIVFGRKGDMPKAISYFEEALKISRPFPRFNDVTIISLTNLGIAYNQSGNRDKALACLQEVVKMLEHKNLPEQSARALLSIGNLYMEDQTTIALDYYKSAYEKCREINGLTALHGEILESIYEAQKKLGHLKEALDALELDANIKDSLQSSNNAIELSNLEALHDLKESQSKIDKLKLEQKTKSLQANIVIVFCLALLGIIATMVVNQKKLKQLNAKLHQHEKELEVHNNTKDKLFSIIGHDLKGPVGNLGALMEIILSDLSDQEQTREMLEMARTQVAASHDILDKLLIWGNSQIKGTIIKPVIFETAPFIAANLQLFANPAAEKKITIHDQISNTIRLYADANHFDFIIRNLIANAIKFCYTGGKVVLNAADSDDGKMVVFSVSDNGVGIDHSLIENIFMPENNSVAGTANEAGTSIGLMICREFAIANGGKVWVESVKGQGSTFYFTLRKAR